MYCKQLRQKPPGGWTPLAGRDGTGSTIQACVSAAKTKLLPQIVMRLSASSNSEWLHEPRKDVHMNNNNINNIA